MKPDGLLFLFWQFVEDDEVFKQMRFEAPSAIRDEYGYGIGLDSYQYGIVQESEYYIGPQIVGLLLIPRTLIKRPPLLKAAVSHASWSHILTVCGAHANIHLCYGPILLL